MSFKINVWGSDVNKHAWGHIWKFTARYTSVFHIHEIGNHTKQLRKWMLPSLRGLHVGKETVNYRFELREAIAGSLRGLHVVWKRDTCRRNGRILLWKHRWAHQNDPMANKIPACDGICLIGICICVNTHTCSIHVYKCKCPYWEKSLGQ